MRAHKHTHTPTLTHAHAHARARVHTHTGKMQTSDRKKYMHTYIIVPCKHNTFGENLCRFAFLSSVAKVSCPLAIHT